MQPINDTVLALWGRIAAGQQPGSLTPGQAKAARLFGKHGTDGNIFWDQSNDKAWFEDDGDGVSVLNRAVQARPAATGIPPQPAIPRNLLPGVSVSSNNHIWFHNVTGTSSQTGEIKPNDPLQLSDVDVTSDDSTARLTSIKQGSTELLAGSGAGILISTYRTAFYRALFAGVTVSRDNPLVVAVTHAGSGTNTTTFSLIGYKAKNSGCTAG